MDFAVWKEGSSPMWESLSCGELEFAIFISDCVFDLQAALHAFEHIPL